MKYLKAPEQGSTIDSFFKHPIRRAMQVAAGGLAVYIAFHAVDVATRADSNKILPPDAITANPVVEYSDHGWSIECFGPEAIVTIPTGGTLSKVASSVDVHNTNAIGESNIPQSVITGAVAKLNGISNPDFVEAGSQVSLPDSCQPATN